MKSLINVEIILSNWKRSICKTIDYPAFDNSEPIVIPDVLTEGMFNFSGFACYETTFMIDVQKVLALNVSNAIGSVEVFMNGETLGIKAKPPYHYDLSSLAWQGVNYLAIEVAIDMKRKRIAVEENQPCIIGNVRLFSH
jgi:hypothetical protein